MIQETKQDIPAGYMIYLYSSELGTKEFARARNVDATSSSMSNSWELPSNKWQVDSLTCWSWSTIETNSTKLQFHCGYSLANSQPRNIDLTVNRSKSWFINHQCSSFTTPSLWQSLYCNCQRLALPDMQDWTRSPVSETGHGLGDCAWSPDTTTT